MSDQVPSPQSKDRGGPSEERADKDRPHRSAPQAASAADQQPKPPEGQVAKEPKKDQEGLIGHLSREAKSPEQHEKDWHEKEYRAKTLINEAHDDKKSLDQRAKEAIQKIIKEYYPEYANRYKIDVEYKGG
jgi:hypothetical protein